MLRPDAILVRLLVVWTIAVSPGAALAAPLQVVQFSPARNSVASPGASVTFDFDKPVSPASITPLTFRVFGRASGLSSGSFAFSNGNQRVSFVPQKPFSAGETVRVNLSHGIQAADLTTLRAAGYYYQFQVRTVASGAFVPIGEVSNRIDDVQTRIYGAAATDLNNDGYVDMATINEVSADVRVCLNRADGSGLYQPFLPAQPIGLESSPNDPADFDADGRTDLCVAGSSSNSVSVLLGAGNGTFRSRQELFVGSDPHGITTLDVDGDGDPDIVNANYVSNQLSMMINNGSGVFAAPTFFEAGVDGEYGLIAADMNNDGIADLVVGGNSGQEVRVLLGNGNGTFTPAGPSQPCGGLVWVIVVDDVNGDGNLDASVANSFSANASILLGNGAGAFGPPALVSTGFHTPSTDLGDLDGDGDPDLVLSVFGGGFWRYYRNDGAGHFAFVREITALDNPSCAVLFDSDNDGDLDLALTDEIADKIMLWRNQVSSAVGPGEPLARFEAQPNQPNPFAGRTRIRFTLAVDARVHLDVFDVSGRRVAVVPAAWMPAGSHTIAFDGRDGRGRPLSAGVYPYRIHAGAEMREGRMVIVP